MLDPTERAEFRPKQPKDESRFTGNAATIEPSVRGAGKKSTQGLLEMKRRSSAKRNRTSVRKVAVGDVLQLKTDSGVLCRVIEIGTGLGGGGDVVEVFPAGAKFDALPKTPVKTVTRVNKFSLRFDFQRVGHLNATDRRFTKFTWGQTNVFCLTEDVVNDAYGRD